MDELEEVCLAIARYAHQDLDLVEAWTLPVLFRRYRALARIIAQETGEA